MSDLTRRGFIGTMAVAAGAFAVLKTMNGGDLTFQNNVPDPLLSGKELPTFKFELEKSKGKVLGNSFGKEVTVKQLPISKGIAGVSMQLEAGVMRELHWHATAAEWAFVLKGRVRTTVINPAGEAETNDFEPGDLWYFPRGHAHMLECLGNEPTHFILVFDNGYFSEFGTFSITDWIGHTPKPLLAKFWSARISVRWLSKGGSLFCPRRCSARTNTGKSSGAKRLASRDTQVSNVSGCAARGFQRRPRMAHRFHSISNFDNSHWCNSRPRTRRVARTSLASKR